MEGWPARAEDLASKISQNPFLEKIFSGKSGKSEKILPIAPRAGSGQLRRARTGSAQLRTPKNRFLDPALGEKILLLGWMVSESLISDVFEFPSVFNFPQPVEGFECHSCKDVAGQAHCEQ